MSVPTLSTLHLFTAQQVFDYVVSKIYEQGGAAFDDVLKKCRYRDPVGRSCAVGMLISDDEYAKYQLEDRSARRAIRVVNDDVSEAVLSLLSMLQDDHDTLAVHVRRKHVLDAEFQETWLVRANNTGASRGLQPWMPAGRKGD